MALQKIVQINLSMLICTALHQFGEGLLLVAEDTARVDKPGPHFQVWFLRLVRCDCTPHGEQHGQACDRRDPRKSP
jgi:hypothetical protein